MGPSCVLLHPLYIRWSLIYVVYICSVHNPLIIYVVYICSVHNPLIIYVVYICSVHNHHHVNTLLICMMVVLLYAYSIMQMSTWGSLVPRLLFCRKRKTRFSAGEEPSVHLKTSCSNISRSSKAFLLWTCRQMVHYEDIDRYK